jgi:hypothetical protein
MVVWTFFKADNDCSTDELVVGIVNNKVHNFVTYSNTVLRLEAINYVRWSETFI